MPDTLTEFPSSSRPSSQPSNRPDDASAHWLSPLLSPRSIAIVGASPRPDSFGARVWRLLRQHNCPADVWMVNPRYDRIDDRPCYPSLDDLPTTPDLAVLVIGNRGMEAEVGRALDRGVGGLVVFANNYLEDDAEPPLLARLKERARDAGVPVCGGNGMGFYNYDSRTLVSFDTPPERAPGHIALVAHSGSIMTYLANTDPRLMFNLAISPGQEINATVADYMDYALDQPTTRVIALFLETLRDPLAFVRALERARTLDVPVVAIKVGATEQSARMAASHSGAIAGNDGAFQAICDRYGVIRVHDIDQLAATALLFSQPRRPGPGHLASLLDSGGLREQMIDLSGEANVEFARLGEAGQQQLAETLEYGLIAENPVDAMGALNADIATTYERCLRILHDDPATSMISLEFEFRDDFSQYPALLEVALRFYRNSDKPFFIINSAAFSPNSRTARELGEQGIVVINGISRALWAVHHLCAHRDGRTFTSPALPDRPSRLTRRVDRIKATGNLSETDALALFSEFGLPVVDHHSAGDLADSLEAADTLGYPVVLKTSRADVLHKSDAGGVRAGLADRMAVQEAYTDIASRLGSEVLVQRMVTGGFELTFGMVNDAQFGPVVLVGAGGIYVELLGDRRFIPAPCGADEARHHIEQLGIARLLRGARGQPACRIDLVARALADFSRMAVMLADEVTAIDANPVIVTPQECVIVDALVIAGT